MRTCGTNYFAAQNWRLWVRRAAVDAPGGAAQLRHVGNKYGHTLKTIIVAGNQCLALYRRHHTRRPDVQADAILCVSVPFPSP
jgi:hypothetical protein